MAASERRLWTRRAVLFSLACAHAPAAPGKGETFPSDRLRFLDPSTEFEIVRLTDPAYSSFLPAYYGDTVSRRGTFLLFSSDRNGAVQAFRLDLKTGEQRQLTEASALDPASLTLWPGERSFCYFDGASLERTPLASLRGREIYRVPEGWQRGIGFSLSGDGMYACLVETKGSASRLRLLAGAGGTTSTVFESGTPIETPLPRPRRAAILYRRDQNSLALVNFDGRDNRVLKTAPGGLGPFLWSADGRTVLYLNFPADKRVPHSIRELTPDTNTDRLIAPTTQFVSFSRNSDASVFVGASGSKGSPHLLILLRVTRRELTLCEHRASDPRTVAPLFSPDSQRVFYQSDKHGKPAIYTIAIDKLVEKTEQQP